MPDALYLRPSRPLCRAEAEGGSVSCREVSSTREVHAVERRLRLVLLSDAENLIVRRHARWFAARGFDLHILHCPMQDRVFESAGPIPGVTTHPGLARPGHPQGSGCVQGAWHLRKLVRTLRPDCLHLMSPRLAAQMAARMTKGPAKIYSPWGADVLADVHQSRWHGYRAKGLLRDFDSMVSASAAIAERAQFYASAERQVIIPWGVEADVFHPQRNTDELRRSLGLRQGQRVIASPRQLGHKYHHDVILRAFATIAARHPELILVIKYAIAQGDLRERILGLVRELGLEARVRILGPSATPEMSHRVMADLLALAEVAISVPSWDGGTPATLFEALASEAVLVLSDIDTNLEFLTPDREARFCRPRDPDDLARALTAALDSDWRCEAARRGRELAQSRAARDEHLNILADHYRSLAEAVSA